MPSPEQFEAGREWEERFAKRIGGRLQPRSGAGPFAKLDVGSNSILWSLKYTSSDKHVVSHDLLDEASLGARGLGGPGVTPALAIEMAGRPVVVMELDEFLAILERPEEFAVPMSKSRQRRMDAHRKREE